MPEAVADRHARFTLMRSCALQDCQPWRLRSRLDGERPKKVEGENAWTPR